jgi:hypothetical protein
VKWLALVAVVLLAVQCTPVRRGPFACDGAQVLSDELTVGEAYAYCQQAVRERSKVAAFWGPTWTEPLRVHVSSTYRISRALVPGHLGNRGFIEMPLRRARENTGALLHEIVHVYAPHDNRFLAEGLAVYLHARLAENPAFPNFGEDLPRLAGRSLSGVTSLDALNAVRTPQPLGSVMDERTAYILAGSFVGFLIERHGLTAFRTLYETGDYQRAYGTSLGALEHEWRAALGYTPPVR